MKSIHERLEANNQRKEELIVSLRRSRDLALIDQCKHPITTNAQIPIYYSEIYVERWLSG